MTIDVKLLFEIVVIVLALKLVVSRWKPPMQESKQALFCMAFGTIIGLVANPTIEGFIWGIISSSVAFYGKDLISNVKTIKEDLKELN